MVSFWILSLLIFHSFANNLKRSAFSFSSNDVPHEFNDINSNLFHIHYPQILSAKQPKDFICNGNGQTMEINDENFQNAAKITSEEGCASIKVFHCTFTNVVIPDSSLSNGQVSIIYIKSIDFFIDDSSFTNCYSNSKIQRTNPSILLESRGLSSKNFPISEYVICHAIYLDENVNHEVKISNCNFIDNGIPTEKDGTIIYSNKVNSLLIELSNFESNTISSRAIETFNTQNIEINSNLFKKMTGSKGSNGGALLIQFANKVTISNNIFDSNTLQPIEDTTSTSEVCGSAFFINLNDILTFTNNTITNHEKFLNSVITFNSNELYSYNNDNDNLPIKRKVTIYDSQFIQNSYSKTTDGNGIGLYIEDYSENLPETDDVEPYILQIEFLVCLFKNNGNSECSSSVLEWSRSTSFMTFTNCNFESNTAKQGSSMFKILNGLSFQFDSIQISNFNSQSFLQFSPATTVKQNAFIKQIEVTLLSITFSNVITDKIKSNFILTEGTTVYESNLNLVNCKFSDISLEPNNFIIQSNSNNLKVTNCDFIYSQSGGSHAISSTKVDGNITVIDSNFQNCLYGLNSIELSDTIKITKCTFVECKNSPVIYGKSKYFLAENCDISFSSIQNPGFYGIQIDQALNAEITNSDFKNTGSSAIRSFYDLDSSVLTATSCNIKGCRTGVFAFHSKNKVVNFINSTIFNEETGQKSCGFLTETIAEITIDSCKFINCFNSQSNSNIGGAITCLKSNPNPRESYTFSNCEFTGCTTRNSICYITADFEVPRFINVIISKSVSNYLFNVAVPQIQEGSVATGVFLFQNVSFIDIENTADGGGGIGFWFQPQNSANSDYTLSFLECRFVNTFWSGSNANSQYGGGAISIESYSCRKFHISIMLCSFYNTAVNNYHGSAIAVITEKSIIIRDCYLENCSVLVDSLNNGGCIHANEVGEKFDFDMVNITINGSICNSDTTAVYFASNKGAKFSMMSCSFINCNKKVASQSSIVTVPQNLHDFHCTNTKFIFNESTNTNSRGIDVHTPFFTFEDCYFYKCGRYDINFGGGILCEDDKNINKDSEIEISLCTFEQCLSDNTGALRLKIFNGVPILYNNTFSNIKANYILALMFSENVVFSHIELNKQFFIKCTNLQSDGGGSGVWVNNHRADGNIYPTYIDFNECEFIENVASNCGGGAFGVGSSTSVRPTELNFMGCSFIGNSCVGSDGGGAIWVRTSITSYVSSCVFKDNRAGNETMNLNGGAIYIRFTTSTPRFYLSDSEFINNSCVNKLSNGHVVFGIYLFSILNIDSCQFIDNGYDENPNSMIYTNSNLQSHFSSFIFTNKETSNSRALYVGSSSELDLYHCDFINCTDKTEKAGAIFYEISSVRSPMFVKISYCTFERNTEGTKSCEMFFYVLDPPYIRDCTFNDDDTLSDLVIINFDESVTEIEPIEYVENPSITCNNCNLNNNFIFGYFENLNRHVELSDYTMEYWVLNNCTDFYLVDNKVIDFFIYDSNFINNSNDGIFLHFSVDGLFEIEDCTFRNNKMNVPENAGSDITGTIFFEKSSNARITSTVFENEDIKEDGFVLKSLISLELNHVSILNCPQDSFSFLFSIENTQTSKILMDSCIVDKSGPFTIDKIIDEIVIKSSSFSNSPSGIHYKPELNDTSEKVDLTSNSIQISDTTFDNFTNYALLLIVLNDINMTCNTIKNCHKIDDNESSPLFELDLKSNTTDQICFEKFTFENNEFNNANDRLMNGGGIGLHITFPDLDEENEQVITIDFIECNFISNKAAQCGGAFAFISGTDGVVISNSTIYTTFSFQNCTFRMNSCNKLRGHALYIEASNVSIEDCTFEGHSLLSTSSDSIEYDINDVLQSSVVYIATAKNDSFSIQNCSFLNNKASSLYILSCEDEVSITGCLFESNDIMSMNSTFSSNNDTITDDIISSSIITIISAKDSITIENCTFHNNSEDSDKNDGIVRASTIFANTQKSFTMKNANFLDNNINDAILIALSDVCINSCKFIVLENTSSVVGCALVINSKMKVDVCDCSFSGYSSVLNQQDSKAKVLRPIQIESNDSVTLTGIEVLDVSGDVFSITSNESVMISNCVLDSSSTEDEVGNSQSDDEVVGNYFIICKCEKFISFESLRVSNYDKAFSFLRRAESITLKNCQIENCQSGAVFKSEILDHMSLKEGNSLLIENVTFSQLKNALIVKELYDQICLEKASFSECTNLENEADKDAIFVISIFESRSTVKVNLTDVKFERNSYSQSTQFDSGGGGIGFVISPHDSTISTIVTVEFNSCTFVSNHASNSGGAVHFTSPSNNNDNSLSFESVSFNYCDFKQNKAAVDTGALRITPSKCSSITVTNCFFTSNEANGNIGALFIEGQGSEQQEVRIFNCEFLSNRCNGSVAALDISMTSSSSSQSTLSSCTFTLNEAGFGIGAVRVDCNCNFLLDLCSFVNNTAIKNEEEGTSLSPIGTRADSLLLAASSHAEVSRSNFTKAVFIDEDCGYQAVFVNRIEGGKKIISLHHCLFSIVNPVEPQLLFVAAVDRSNTTVTDSSFTHFYAKSGDDDIEINDREGNNVTANTSVQTKFVSFDTTSVARSNFSVPFYHIKCSANSQVSLIDCCFDTTRPFALSPTAMRLSKREAVNNRSEVERGSSKSDKTIRTENEVLNKTSSKSEVHNKDNIKTSSKSEVERGSSKSDKNYIATTEKVKQLNSVHHQIRDDIEDSHRVVFMNATFDSDYCVFPSIVPDLISAIEGSKNNTGNSNDIDRERNRRRALIIGLSVGAAALVVIAVIIIVIVVYKKKHKEMKKTMQYDEECQEKMEQEEIDAINERYNQNDDYVLSKSNKVENLDSEFEYEETDLEEFDL